MSTLPSGPRSRTAMSMEWIRDPVAMIQKNTNAPQGGVKMNYLGPV